MGVGGDTGKMARAKAAAAMAAAPATPNGDAPTSLRPPPVSPPRAVPTAAAPPPPLPLLSPSDRPPRPSSALLPARGSARFKASYLPL